MYLLTVLNWNLLDGKYYFGEMAKSLNGKSETKHGIDILDVSRMGTRGCDGLMLMSMH